MVLLVVDAQQGITNERLYCWEAFIGRTAALIAGARAAGVEVIYVRHDDGEGSELTEGMPGFAIDSRFQPLPGERIFDKTVNSPFCGTGLLEYLQAKHVRRIMVVGLQTDYCIDATVKCGFEHGFRMIVPAGANSTFDNAYMSAEQTYRYYNEFMWPRRYAQCIAFEAALGLLEGHDEV